jgi:sugar phosphate isomerase/epimerase
LVALCAVQVSGAIMQKVLSSHLFVNHRLTTVWLERIQKAGFEGVEIFCARQHLDYWEKAQIRELGHWFRESELKVWSVHSPMYTDEVWGRSGPEAIVNITETKKLERAKMVDEVKRALDIADIIPFRYLIQHIGVRDEEFCEHKLDAAFNSFEELKAYAGMLGVEILIENTPNQMSTAERLNHFLSTTHLDLKYCFDVGHAHIGRGIVREFEIMQDRISSTHIHDNDGIDDLHLFPLQNEGNIDWHETMKVLGSHPEQYPLVLELKEKPQLERPIDHAKNIADGLDKLI